MNEIDEILGLVASKLSESAQIRFVEPASRKDVATVNEALGTKLPESYVDFICGPKRFEIAYGTDAYFRFLDPKESLALIEREIENFDEEAFGDSEEEIQYAHRESAVRRRMFPFQYISTYVYDFYCFHLDDARDSEMRILPIYHDDYELSDWVTPDGAEMHELSFFAHLKCWAEDLTL